MQAVLFPTPDLCCSQIFLWWPCAFTRTTSINMLLMLPLQAQLDINTVLGVASAVHQRATLAASPAIAATPALQ